MNIKNYGVIIGRLTKNPTVFTNSDGSRKVMLTVAAQDNFKNAAGERDSQFVNVEAFVSNKSANLGVYEYMHKGDMVGIGYTVKSNSYQKNGETVYTQVLQVTDVDLMESKSAQARRAAVTANAAAVAPAPAAADAAPAETPAEAPAEAPAPSPKTSGRKRGKAKAAADDECLPFAQ